jgi:hypothetical protein
MCMTVATEEVDFISNLVARRGDMTNALALFLQASCIHKGISYSNVHSLQDIQGNSKTSEKTTQTSDKSKTTVEQDNKRTVEQ